MKYDEEEVLSVRQLHNLNHQIKCSLCGKSYPIDTGCACNAQLSLTKDKRRAFYAVERRKIQNRLDAIKKNPLIVVDPSSETTWDKYLREREGKA